MVLTYTSGKTIAEIFPYFSDMQAFAAVHPVIYKTEQLNANTYRFYEKLRVLAIPVRFSYKVTIEDIEPNTHVKMHSSVQRGVHLHLSFVFKTENGKTRIAEIIEIKAPPLVKQVFAAILQSAHRKLFRNIELR